MNKLPLVFLIKVANVESTALVARAIRSAANLAIVALAWHPHLDIVLTESGCAQLLCRHVKDAVRESQRLNYLDLNLQHIIQGLLALSYIVMCEGEHFDLAELMQPVQASGMLAFASLSAEAMTEGDHFVRQGLSPEHLIRVHAR